MNAAGAATSSLSDGNSGVEPIKVTFEQLVEQRFLALERAIARMPHAIHTAMSEGSHASAEEFASRVLHHIFNAL